MSSHISSIIAPIVSIVSSKGASVVMSIPAMAGIDITTDAPLLDTIETIGAMIDEICELTDELEDK